MKLFVRAPMSEKRLEELRGVFQEVVYDPWNTTGERYYEDKMLEALLDVQPDVLITELDRITEKVLTGYPHLKAIGDCRAAPANIEIDACTKHNIPVLCTPARNAQAVAEMLVGLLLMHMRNIAPSIQWVKDGKWIEGTTPYYEWMGNELQGKSVGFVGFGAVGRAAAKLLEAFGCEIYYYDPYVTMEQYHKQELSELFQTCDIVSIHLPVLDATKRIIDATLLQSMKEGAIFVNTARSAVVDMQALTQIASTSKLKGIILDVLESEPPTKEELEILTYPNVLLTPHICGATYEVTNHQSDIITERLIKWLRKEDLSNIVFNRAVLQEN